jgi:hypothetical protein
MSWQFTTNADGNVVDMLKTAQAQVRKKATPRCDDMDG